MYGGLWSNHWHRLIDPTYGSPSGSVSQTLVGYDTSIPYIVSTFFRPYSLYASPVDPSADQACTMNIQWGSLNLFSRRYTQQNGTQSGYSFVQFNQVRQTQPNAALTLSYSCPDGYIGNGIADFFFDTVSVKPATSSVVVCPDSTIG